MSDYEALSLLVGVSAIGVPSLFAILAMRRAAAAERRAAAVEDRVQELHVTVNSRMDELLKAARGEARGEGHAEGREEVKREVATGALPPLPTPSSTPTPPPGDVVTTTTTHTEVS